MMSGPTPYRDINATLHQLLTGVQRILGSRCAGLYLYGSLASGDFDPARSDIDFLVVTTTALTDDQVAALGAMHAELLAHGGYWASKLEGSYLPQPDLPRYDPDAGPYPTTNEGHFYLAPHGSDWIIQRHILREHSVIVTGPPLRDQIEPVSPEALRDAVRDLLQTWWAPMLADPSRLASDEYQAYAILTMCRALHALHHGTIVSKPAAARWAQNALGDAWREPVERALAWQRGEPLDLMPAALDLIRHTLDSAQPPESDS